MNLEWGSEAPEAGPFAGGLPNVEGAALSQESLTPPCNPVFLHLSLLDPWNLPLQLGHQMHPNASTGP